MRVLDIYSGRDLDKIVYNQIPVSTIMDQFFLRFPKNYKDNYDKNIIDLEILKVDKLHEEKSGGEFFTDFIQVFYNSKVEFLIHELMHISSYNRAINSMAISRSVNYSLYEAAMIEGMTEFLACLARNSEPNSYHYHVFVVTMLSSIDRFFEPYFIPSYDNFIKLFPNKKDIVSLMYSLEFFHTKFDAPDYSDWDIKNMRASICNIIDGLIDIELSFDKTSYERKLYAEKFMHLISDNELKNQIGCFYKKYVDYADDRIKKRILGR